jgi:hypothetical protein
VLLSTMWNGAEIVNPLLGRGSSVSQGRRGTLMSARKKADLYVVVSSCMDVIHPDMMYDERMDEDKAVNISMSGKLTYSDSITLSQAAQIIAFIDSAAAIPANPSLTSSRPATLIEATSMTHGTAANPREALDASGAKTNPEKIVALALYVAQEDGAKDTFTVEDIKPLFRRARESTPRNFTRDLDVAIRAGWIAEAEGKGEYYVTDKAIGVLDSTFESLRSGRGKQSASSSSSRKPRKTGNGIPEAFKGVDTIEPRADGLIEYHKLKKKTEKFLWAVHKAQELGITSVTGKELAWLTDRLGDGIGVGDISANYRSLNKAGYVNKTLQDNKIRITPGGEDYLKSIKPE